MLTNRPEFAQADLAVLARAGVPFSIYNTSAPGQVQHLVKDAGARVLITEQALLPLVRESVDGLVEHIIVIDGVAPAGTIPLTALMDQALPGRTEPPGPANGDLATIIYTSGTTGPSKGVQLSHRNVLTACLSHIEGLGLPASGRVISWLPAAHMAERMAHYYLPLVLGLEVTYCPNMREITEYLGEVRPTWFTAVPRVWEKLKGSMDAHLLQLAPGERAEIEDAMASSRELFWLTQQDRTVPPDLRERVAAADRTYFCDLRERLGLDRAEALLVGAAPTPIEVLEFFHVIGLPIAELWGLSESSALGTMNPLGRVRVGTVGTPLPGVRLRIAPDGEVQLRGESVMVGYRNLPAVSAEAFTTDGWLRTGDLGELDDHGYLRILGRKKELIINSSGKNMSPIVIEDAVKAGSPLIGQVVVQGDGRPYNVALILLDPEYAFAWAAQRRLQAADLAELVEDPDVIAEVSAGVQQGNARLSRVEQVKRFALLGADWQPGGQELTPTMKLRRSVITANYAATIESLYRP
jgi:long-subunit acyl-CoA synthetase (AMP-forming)